jgi:hypothetical protein
MSAPDLDRILEDEPPIDPSPFFAARVMRAVRQEARGYPAIPFPWKIMGPSLVLSALLVINSVMTMPAPALPADLANVPSLGEAAQWLSLSLIGSFLTTWWFIRS